MRYLSLIIRYHKVEKEIFESEESQDERIIQSIESIKDFFASFDRLWNIISSTLGFDSCSNCECYRNEQNARKEIKDEILKSLMGKGFWTLNSKYFSLGISIDLKTFYLTKGEIAELISWENN